MEKQSEKPPVNVTENKKTSFPQLFRKDGHFPVPVSVKIKAESEFSYYLAIPYFFIIKVLQCVQSEILIGRKSKLSLVQFA